MVAQHNLLQTGAASRYGRLLLDVVEGDDLHAEIAKLRVDLVGDAGVHELDQVANHVALVPARNRVTHVGGNTVLAREADEDDGLDAQRLELIIQAGVHAHAAKRVVRSPARHRVAIAAHALAPQDAVGAHEQAVHELRAAGAAHAVHAVACEGLVTRGMAIGFVDHDTDVVVPDEAIDAGQDAVRPRDRQFAFVVVAETDEHVDDSESRGCWIEPDLGGRRSIRSESVSFLSCHGADAPGWEGRTPLRTARKGRSNLPAFALAVNPSGTRH